jgi:hypothetical protein
MGVVHRLNEQRQGRDLVKLSSYPVIYHEGQPYVVDNRFGVFLNGRKKFIKKLGRNPVLLGRLYMRFGTIEKR